MNPIELLAAEIKGTFSTAEVQLVKPLKEAGVWLLDIELGRISLDVQWSNTAGFGITTTASSQYGTGADEVCKTLEQAVQRITYLLRTGEHTTPPIGVMISRLRDKRGLTQKELAERMEVTQATISGIEKRSDIQASTLHRVACALGGDLEVFVCIQGARYRVLGNAIDVAEVGAAIPCAAPTDKSGLLVDYSDYKGLDRVERAPSALAAIKHFQESKQILMIPN